MRFHYGWLSYWAFGIFIISPLTVSKSLRGIYGFVRKLNFMDVTVSDLLQTRIQPFPLKCHFHFRNDSLGCIDVSISNYEPQTLPFGTCC